MTGPGTCGSASQGDGLPSRRRAAILDGQVGGLQQQARVRQPPLRQPFSGLLPTSLAEAPGEGAHAHVRVPGHVLQRDRLGQPVQRPLPGRRSGAVGVLRTGCSMNCACPPSRHGATTQRRAAAEATAAPWSRRTRCRHRSMPAAPPADVRMRPLSTNSTSGSTVDVGEQPRQRVTQRPVRGGPPAVQQTGRREQEGRGAQADDAGPRPYPVQRRGEFPGERAGREQAARRAPVWRERRCPRSPAQTRRGRRRSGSPRACVPAGRRGSRC